ncbi:MAG TPA: hypothetical protein VI588_00965, partial [Candidatus Gracilibacteria bacterium]|nr:hypothetical protein [Candidatus Gracilibacteria bacterium]
KLLLLQDTLGWDKVRDLSVNHKPKAFGFLSSLLFKPKVEDVSIIYEEKRYQAFWHIVGNSFFEYKRKVRYQVPVETVVEDVTFMEENNKVDPQDHTFEIEGIEHCKENYREEVMVDAQTDQPGDFTRYLKFPTKILKSTDDIRAEDSFIVNLETRASFLVRKVLNELVKPIKADEILNEKIAITELSLYFYPVYTFEYHFVPKNQKVLVEFDGVTGEIRKGRKLSDKLRNSFTNDELFDFAKEVANFVPGGGLAMMAGRKAMQMAKHK